MAKELDEIIYDALTADSNIMELCGYVEDTTPARIYSTCVEVPPTDADNTPLPYIVITDDPLSNSIDSKDDEWESDWDNMQASVIISCESPKKVKQLRRMVRHAIAVYVANMTDNVPVLRSFGNDGISWDWTKPCYYDTLHYQCEMQIDLEDDGEEEEDE